MRTLLSEVIKKIEALPPDIQDEIAKQILEDLENERKWQEALDNPQDKLDKLASKALKESVSKETKKLGFDEL